MFKKTIFSFRRVFSDIFYVILGTSLAINLLLIYYFILLQTTTLEVFFSSNNAFYNVASITSTILISFLFGVAVAFFVYQMRLKNPKSGSAEGVLGGAFGAIATGCPVCGAWLISALGIGGGLVAFPFQGLELKALAIVFLGWSVYSGSQAIYNQKKGICPPPKKGWLKYSPYIAGIVAVVFLYALPVLATKYHLKVSFQPESSGISTFNTDKNTSGSLEVDLDSVLPPNGYTINASYSDIGPRLIEAGVIDLEKFKTIYERSGQPLTQKQLAILSEGSNEKITITQDNAYFLINFLWAVGLSNQNPILDEGPLVQYAGLAGIGGFASTGGWVLGKLQATDYYSKLPLISLNEKQQQALEDFAYNSYRPCCNNPTALADCNHGMAALGLGELMASQGASADEIFEAQKYFNSFWFPQQYLDLAKYFKIREGREWNEVEPRIVMGEDYSTASGWSRVRRWLQSNNILEEIPSSGGGCGV